MSVIVSENLNQAVETAVLHILVLVQNYLSNESKPFVTVGLSGGSLVQQLSRSMIQHREDFAVYASRMKFYYIDERFVPFTNNDSTHKGYVDCGFFESLNIPSENIYAIDENARDVEACAVEYENRLKTIINENNGFDIIIGGFGPDGHICSLFPGHELFVEPQTRIVVSISDSPKPPPQRVTITMPVVNNSTNFLMLGFGEGKAEIVKRILVDKDESLPAASIKSKALTWYLDAPAAKLLQN